MTVASEREFESMENGERMKLEDQIASREGGGRSRQGRENEDEDAKNEGMVRVLEGKRLGARDYHVHR